MAGGTAVVRAHSPLHLRPFASGREPGFGGDGGLATAAVLDPPSSVIFEDGGDAFIACIDSHCLRRVDAKTGIITTFGGTGVAALAGDGGHVNAASHNRPTCVVFDGAGDLLVADQGNQVIRRVSVASGMNYPLAGPHEAHSGGAKDGFSSIAFDIDGSPLIAAAVSHLMDGKMGESSAICGTALLNGGGTVGVVSPHRLACFVSDGAGDVLVIDNSYHMVRRATPSSGMLYPLAGTDAAGLCVVLENDGWVHLPSVPLIKSSISPRVVIRTDRLTKSSAAGVRGESLLSIETMAMQRGWHVAPVSALSFSLTSCLVWMLQVGVFLLPCLHQAQVVSLAISALLMQAGAAWATLSSRSAQRQGYQGRSTLLG